LKRRHARIVAVLSVAIISVAACGGNSRAASRSSVTTLQPSPPCPPRPHRHGRHDHLRSYLRVCHPWAGNNSTWARRTSRSAAVLDRAMASRVARWLWASSKGAAAWVMSRSTTTHKLIAREHISVGETDGYEGWPCGHMKESAFKTRGCPVWRRDGQRR